MRAIGVVLLLTGFAAADPPARGPSKVIEAPAWEWEPLAHPTTKVPGMKGADSLAVVIEPGSHGDARPWPHGMLIQPPDTGDRNAIEPGTSYLPTSDKLSVKLARTLDLGVGHFLDWLLTPLFVR